MRNTPTVFSTGNIEAAKQAIAGSIVETVVYPMGLKIKQLKRCLMKKSSVKSSPKKVLANLGLVQIFTKI